jgi:hypothetical protein
MLEYSLFAVFLVGLLGGGHCIGMCGGIVTALSITLPADRPRWPFLLAYNAGRLLSYSLAGALMGLVGQSSFMLAHLLPVQKILYACASLMLVLLGLYLMGIATVLQRFEQIGQHLWRRIQPIGKRLLPLQSLPQALALGMVWGWLPCGLVYSVLIAALASGGAAKGALLMACFGLGTLPALLTMGGLAYHLKAQLQKQWVRRCSGLLILGMGIAGFAALRSLPITG